MSPHRPTTDTLGAGHADAVAEMARLRTDLENEKRERRQQERILTESQERLRLANVVPSIGGFDRDFTTGRMSWSDDVEALYGRSAGDLPPAYEEWLALLPSEDAERYERSVLRCIADRRSDFLTEFRVRGPDGAFRWLEARGRITYGDDGRPLHMLGVNIDITERKRFENNLIEQAEALWRSNRELEQFAHVSSHDLKEPLRKIASFAQLLSLRHGADVGTDGRHYLDVISNAAGRMGELIDDFLMYSRLNKPASLTETVDVAAVASSVAAALDIPVSVAPMPKAKADPLQVRQLLQNLLSNAAKFRDRHRTPDIRVFSEKRGNFIFFAVADNGIGIEPAYVERIFRLFQRLNPTDYPGTGVGLAVARKIVERQGGRIWVESRPGVGSTFYFSLPLAE